MTGYQNEFGECEHKKIMEYGDGYVWDYRCKQCKVQLTEAEARVMNINEEELES